VFLTCETGLVVVGHIKEGSFAGQSDTGLKLQESSHDSGRPVILVAVQMG